MTIRIPGHTFLTDGDEKRLADYSIPMLRYLLFQQDHYRHPVDPDTIRRAKKMIGDALELKLARRLNHGRGRREAT